MAISGFKLVNCLICANVMFVLQQVGPKVKLDPFPEFHQKGHLYKAICVLLENNSFVVRHNNKFRVGIYLRGIQMTSKWTLVMPAPTVLQQLLQ